ncbi:rhodanese-like domain-containing protein [Streptomyces sodiiphilus]|uniref:Rhodanese-like domain-containing protein n=1 Tax=Streptomyces sodiiphilus TaxID=226217 RepID=A0ABN2PVB8_9ACTN
MPTPSALAPDQASSRLDELTVIDVRTPAEYSAGHLPGAHNIPLDQLQQALPALKEAAGRGDLLVVCASGSRSATACALLAEHHIPATTLTGGTIAWQTQGNEVERPAAARTGWAMERQVRLTAGLLVLTGVVAGLFFTPALLLAGGVAAGLVFSAVTNTCGMAVLLGRLPHNRRPSGDLNATLAALRG